MIVKLLTEHHLEFLSLKGGCTGSFRIKPKSNQTHSPNLNEVDLTDLPATPDYISTTVSHSKPQNNRLVPHVDKAPLPLRILRLVTSNFLPVENPTHPTAHAPERASVYILGQFRTSK